MTISRYKSVRMHNIKLKVNELKVSWDDNSCKHIHKKRHLRRYHNDTKYHATLYTIFSVYLLHLTSLSFARGHGCFTNTHSIHSNLAFGNWRSPCSYSSMHHIVFYLFLSRSKVIPKSNNDIENRY